MVGWMAGWLVERTKERRKGADVRPCRRRRLLSSGDAVLQSNSPSAA